ncbi:adenylate/guanylate cyclase domain-containing protein [Rivularia sp. UHCC 0363]|uniref:adenylate/guanylate cyclase domain-containing protein n=1 Tax=Rivularia sp. UHCC 0363 TaxID=3110244 RepID=UPI002B20F2C9|nr:adenylate/guanylate cyclase domain-containing protein [Rivularia sp. UHCC 0363]MEA5597195.1 adenylate/guanylate cyclase domain-containing protein [Rivularia sp. UHCC 0363]
MKYHVLEKIFNKHNAPRKFESLELNSNFSILHLSKQVQSFAYYPQEVSLHKDVRLGFPEFVGLEDAMTSVLDGEQELFELEGIHRFSGERGDFYIDIYIVGEPVENRLIILIEDVSDRMVLEQKLNQRVNETNLLSSTLVAYKNYMDKVIASMADALIVTNKSGKINKVNKATVELLGYTEEELVDQQISLIIDDNKLLQKAIQQRSLYKKYFQNVEVVCRTKLKERKLIAFSCSVIRKQIDGIEDIVYIGRDITAKKRRQQRKSAQYAITNILSESITVKQVMPQILQTICESLEWDLGELWTPNQYLAANHNSSNPVLRCVEMWSSRRIDVREFEAIAWLTTFTSGVGLPGKIWETVSPLWCEDIANDDVCPRLSQVEETQLHAAFGFPILHDNKILGVMIFFSREVLFRDEDLLQMMVSIGSQIAQFLQRKQAESALLESEERYRDLFENANDLIQSVNPYGRFLYVNRAWRETLGYSEADVAKMNVFDIVHPNHRMRCRDVFYRIVSMGNFEQLQAAFITKKGQTIFLEGNVNCKIVESKVIAIRAIFRDVTARISAEKALQHQQEQTERLLLSILPSSIANRLRQGAGNIAENFDDVTVLFGDIVGFTQIAASVSAKTLVNLLNQIFSVFDRLSLKYGLEKIKTIGDAYMVVGGLPTRTSNHPQAVASMALEMQNAIIAFNRRNNLNFSIRIGIHTGSVVAGVIGLQKFTYDLWGNTVNIASRMESHGLSGKIQVTVDTYNRLRHQFILEKRGEISVKGKGNMTTYFLIGKRE